MTRTQKVFIGLGAALPALAVAVLIALAWLLYTPSGLRFALDRGVALTDHQFTYASANGTLAGTTTIAGLRYRDTDGTSLQIERATVQIQPWALLRKRLHVRKARIDGIQLTLVRSKTPGTGSTFSLKPPLTLTLDDARLTHIAISNAGRPVFTADSLALAGRWSARRLIVRALQLRAPAGSADLAGTLALARGHRGRGTAHVDWTQDGVHYTAALASQSDGKTATLSAVMTTPFALKLTATLALDHRHAWTLALAAPAFDARALPMLPTSLKTVALDLHGAGDARGGKLTGTLAANGHTVSIDPAQFAYAGKTLTLDPLRLTAPTMPGVATATGRVQLGGASPTAALDIVWTGVQLPTDLVGQVLATHGKVHVSGSTAQYALRGKLAVGPPGRLSDVDVDLAGTPHAIALHTLKLVQKNGGLDAHGRIGLEPRLSWQLDATAKRFDPGAILAGWDGALDFNLATQGELAPQGPRASVKLDHAGGTLRGRAVAGSKADLTITQDNWLDGTVLLVAGGSRVQIDGKPGKQINATVALNVASLNDWLPGAAGTVTGKFTVEGRWPRLSIAGDLNGAKLRDGGRHIDSLRLTAALPDISQPGGKLDVALRGVEASGLDFASVDVNGGGAASAHHITLDAKGKPLSLALAVHGNWQGKTGRWSGTLSGVELAPQGMPVWRQQQPSAMTWQKGAATLAQFCLAAGGAELCLAGGRDARGAIAGRYTLQRLPLQLLAALVASANPPQATGDISGSGQFGIAANGTLSGNASLAASAGSVAFASTAAQPLLAWTSATASATASGNSQRITLHGALTDGGSIDGSLDVTGATHALSGSLTADLRSLAFIGALSPEVANVKGTLTGSLQLGGTLASPQFSGRLQTHGFSAELPRAGLELRDGDFALTGDPAGRLAINGQITSGEGVLHVDGDTGLTADAPLTLSLKGDNVLVADIPAARVIASPDLHVARKGGAFELTGSVAIPRAKVEVEKLPGQGPAQASPDVVIVDAPPAPPVSPLALNADFEVKLGDAVAVQGYGFDGKVHGQLAVQVRPNQTATGRGQIGISGKYEAYGQNLTIERGRLLFAGTRIDDPGLDLRAVRKIRANDVTVGLSIRGTAQRPVLTVFSDPAMEQSEALSYLVTGRPLDALKSGEGDTLNTAAQALGGLAGDRIAKSIGSRLGLEAGVSSSEALGGSAFTAGKYLSPRLFLSYGVGLFTPGQVITLRYTLNRFLQFEAENATTGNRASLNYRIEK